MAHCIKHGKSDGLIAEVFSVRNQRRLGREYRNQRRMDSSEIGYAISLLLLLVLTELEMLNHKSHNFRYFISTFWDLSQVVFDRGQ